MNKILVIVSLAVISVFSFVGCSKKSTEKSGKVVLTFSIWGTPEQVKTEKMVIDAFEKKNPGIKIELLHIPLRYDDKLMTMITAGTPPDVMMMEIAPYPSFASKGSLLDLGPYIKRDKIDLNDIYPLALNSFKYQGKLYGFPRDISGFAMFYNKTLFDSAGIPYPDEKWTWADFKSACRKLTKDINGDGIIDQYGAIAPDVLTVIVSNGGEVLDDPYNPTKCVITTPEAKAGVKFVESLYKEKIVASPEVTTYQGSYQMFMAGKIGMYFNGRWMVPELRKSKGFDWDVSVVPKGKKRVTRQGGTAYCISSTTKHPEEAWAFVKFYTGPEGVKIAIKGGRTTPIYKSIANSQEFLGQKPPENMLAFVNTMEIGIMESYIPENAEIRDILYRNLELIPMGKKSADEVCDNIKKQMDEFLVERSKNKSRNRKDGTIK